MKTLDRNAPDGKPWREDALHELGAGWISWPSTDGGPIVDKELDLSKYAETVKALDAAGRAPGAAALRVERDRRLAACDWTQMPDCALKDGKAREWQAYRQALRDLPANTPDPANPTWPTPPEK